MNVETAPVAAPRDARRRLSRFRSGLLVLALPFLSLALVFTAPTSARAWATPPAPVLISGAMKSPPARLISWTPQGRVVMLAMGVGMLAWQTKDSWWPYVEDYIDGLTPEKTYSYGGWTLYTQGSAPAYYNNCHTQSVVSAPRVPDETGWQGVAMNVNWTCYTQGFANFTPSYTLRTISRCMDTRGNVNIRSNVFSVYGDLGAYTGGGGAKNGTDNIQMTPNRLCENASNHMYGPEYPVDVWAGLATSGEAMQNFILQHIPDLNADLPDLDDLPFDQTTTVQCKKPDGTMGTVTDTLTGHPGKVAMPSCVEEFGPGSVPWSGSISRGPRGAQEPVGTFSIDQGLYEEWRDCFGPTGVLCKTAVYVDGEVCKIGRDVCVIWPRIARGEPERVECRFGTHVLPLSDCNPLKRAYDPATPGHVTNPEIVRELEPDVDAPPRPEPEPEPSPSPSPSPSPTPTPDPTTNPTPTPSSPPTTGPNPEPTPPTTPETDPDSKGCWGETWSWNPISWVYTPVKCALKWAFVPKTSVQVRVARVDTAFEGSFPFTVPAMVGGIGGNVGGGCPDWNVLVGADTWSAVCDSSFTAAIRGARGWLTGGMLAAAFWPLVRGLFFASVPIIKPTPTEPK